MNPIISLVLCTYNNADSLALTLWQLAKQKLGDSNEVEIIVINNNSSDHTQSIIEAAKFSTIKYLFFIESKQGLSSARNLGVEKSSGSYILFTDDDAEIPDNWLQTYLDHIKDRPTDCLFGRISVIWDKPQPWWYDDRYKGFFAVIDHGDAAFQVTSGRHPFFGKNFCVHKSIILDIGGFDPKLGRKGNELLGGEESAVFQYLLTKNKVIWYYADINVGHRLKEREYTVDNISKQHLACAKPIIWLSNQNTGKKIMGRNVLVLKDHLVFILEHGISLARAWLKNNKTETFYYSLELRRAIKVVLLWIQNPCPK